MMMMMMMIMISSMNASRKHCAFAFSITKQSWLQYFFAHCCPIYERTVVSLKVPRLCPLVLSDDSSKGKVLPRTGHEGPEEEQMYSSTLPLTSALDWGGWSTPRPGKDPATIV